MNNPFKRSTACRLMAFALLIAPAFQANAITPKCPDFVAAPNVALSQSNMLESIVFDKQGRMLLSNVNKGEVWALATPNSTPTTIATGIGTIGGLALGDGNDLYVGSGNSINGALPTLGAASIYRVNLETGEKVKYASGLAMSNGVKRSVDGTLYVSDDLAKVLGRVTTQRDGVKVDKIWLEQNSNGMAFSQDGKTLYVNQSFPSAIKSIDLTSSPPKIASVAALTGLESLSVLDGLAIDKSNNLFAVAWLTGKVFKSAQNGGLCVLAEGLGHPSDLAVGSGPHFNNTSLYVITHGGKVFELPGVAH